MTSGSPAMSPSSPPEDSPTISGFFGRRSSQRRMSSGGTPESMVAHRRRGSSTEEIEFGGRVIPSNESPLRRAGLLAPHSYGPTSSFGPRQAPAPHTQDTIRASTMQLSNLVFSPPKPELVGRGSDSFIFPGTVGLEPSSHQNPVASLLSPLRSSASSAASVDLSASTVSYGSSRSGSNNGTQTPRASSPGPSGISLLLARRQDEASSREDDVEDVPSPAATQTPRTPLQPLDPISEGATPIPSPIFPSHSGYFSPDALNTPTGVKTATPSEQTPLLTGGFTSYSTVATPNVPGETPPAVSWTTRMVSTTKQVRHCASRDVLKDTATTAVKSLPAVLLGSLLNVLDGVSYGMIIFPASGVFANLGSMGVSMFFVTAVLAQLVYTIGGSGFAGANGSMMIEVVPFFHIIANIVSREIGEDNPRQIIATTLFAFALSSVLTGVSFFLLGALKLGNLIGFFPRHILVGCIGGVGAFLIETGLTVSTRIDDDDFDWSIKAMKFMFLDLHNVMLWGLPLALAVLLRVITHKYTHQLVFPIYFLVIPMLFYIVLAAARIDLGEIRQTGWLFDLGDGSEESWYKFYSYLDWRLVRWKALGATLPTQFALLFFNILHPPLNVPALSVSLDEDVDTNKELVAHGYSNLLAGCFGTVPNYLVYVNTLLFYRVGGGTRIAGFLLAIANVILLVIGTGPIAYIPVMVVGALIFVLGIDLVKEALWDTRHRVSRSEYATIASIILVMTIFDFVMGVLWGIIVSCFFFVVQNSQRRSVRALHSGASSMSAVRRPASQRAYLREVSQQTTIIRLQGFLFFGTITHVEGTIKGIFDAPSWERNPVRFLVLDLTLVAGVDMSSAEAFVRIQRMLAAKRVSLVLCGFQAESPVGRALENVELLGAEGVELFSSFNDAMEWTENSYLRSWYRHQKIETTPVALPGRQDTEQPFPLHQSYVGSPRRSHLHDAGNRTIANDYQDKVELTTEPYNTLQKAFSSYGDLDPETFQPLGDYMERVSLPSGETLFKQDDESDALYFIESGVLRARYQFADSNFAEESMVAGTVAGELSALAELPRNATVVVEFGAVLWKLSIANLRRLEEEKPALGRALVQFVLKAAKVDYDILLSALSSKH